MTVQVISQRVCLLLCDEISFERIRTILKGRKTGVSLEKVSTPDWLLDTFLLQ